MIEYRFDISYLSFRIYNIMESLSSCSTNLWMCTINEIYAYLTGMVFWRENIWSFWKMGLSVNHTSMKTVMRNIHINGMQHSDIDILVRIWFMRMFNHRRTRLHIYKTYLRCFYSIHCIHSWFFWIFIDADRFRYLLYFDTRCEFHVKTIHETSKCVNLNNKHSKKPSYRIEYILFLNNG